MVVANPRRRGRPPGQVSDTSPSDSPVLAADVRTGWLLRSWRLRLAPESNARSFAERLACLGRSADASRVSRWETGRLPVPFDIIAAYEEALDLPHGCLVALAMVTRKIARPRGDLSGVLDPRHVSAERFQVALDVAVDGRPGGGDWLDIGSFVATHPHRVILPTSVWRRLVQRLVHELTFSVGAAYATRSQAALLLTLHDIARIALVTAVGEHVTGSPALVVADAIALLEQIEDRRAGDLLIRLLEHPQEATRNGAIFAAAAKVSHGQFDTDQLAALERTLIALARRHGLDSGGLFGRIADIVEVLPPDAAERVRRAAPQVPAMRPPAPTAPTPPRSSVVRLARRVARADGEPEEPMLERLVEEALSHKAAERRFQAALSMALSPYRARVARGAASALRDLLRHDPPPDPYLAERLVMLLTLVATPAEHELMRTLAEERSGPHVPGALLALAHIPPSDVPGRVDLWALTSPGAADQAALRASLYYAGMTGDRLLEEVQHDHRHPEWVRVAASWWLHEGPAIHEHPPIA